MIKGIIVVSCLLLMTAIVMGCAATTSNSVQLFPEPPDAMGYVEAQEIQLVKGSYQWNYAVADAPSPDHLVKGTPVSVVESNARLTMAFKGDEPQEIWAGLWINNNFTPLRREENVFILPSEPGIYVLSLGGKWSAHDHVSYAAAIEIQKHVE